MVNCHILARGGVDPPALSLNELAASLGISLSTAEDLRDQLVGTGILTKAGAEGEKLLPARDPRDLSIYELLVAVRHHGEKYAGGHLNSESADAETVLQAFEDALRKQDFAAVSLYELALSPAAEVALEPRNT